MNVNRLLGLEVQGFLWLLAAMLVYRLLTRQISLSGLLASKPASQQVSPERVQLLMATLVLSLYFVQQAARTGVMPNVSAQWLTVFGSSSGIYAATKAARLYIGKNAGKKA